MESTFFGAKVRTEVTSQNLRTEIMAFIAQVQSRIFFSNYIFPFLRFLTTISCEQQPLKSTCRELNNLICLMTKHCVHTLKTMSAQKIDTLVRTNLQLTMNIVNHL